MRIGQRGDFCIHFRLLRPVWRNWRDVFHGSSIFGRDTPLLGLSGLFLRCFLGFLGGDTSFFGCFQVRGRPGQLFLLSALVGEPGLLLLGQARFFGRRDARLFCGNFGELKLCRSNRPDTGRGKSSMHPCRRSAARVRNRAALRPADLPMRPFPWPAPAAHRRHQACRRHTAPADCRWLS